MSVLRLLPRSLPKASLFIKKFHRSNSNKGILAPEVAPIYEQRDKYIQMNLQDKRRHYKCEQFYTLENIPTWGDYFVKEKTRIKPQLVAMYKDRELDIDRYNINIEINKKVSIWKGNITELEVDAIVNAANSSLLGGGGVDGAIHAAAGPGLLQECRMLNGCQTGDAKLTGGYELPARYVIHTVGPQGENPKMLQSCYERCLSLILKEQFRSVAFPCISTGIYGYPQEAAALIALRTIRRFLETHYTQMDRIVFCLFLPSDLVLYECLMQLFFPTPE